MATKKRPNSRPQNTFGEIPVTAINARTTVDSALLAWGLGLV